MGIFDFLYWSKEIRRRNYDNGDIKEEYQVKKNGKRHGFYKIYHPNQQLKVETSYTNDIQDDGVIISYHDNGTKARKVTLLSGELSGVFMEWYSNGKNKKLGNYLASGKQIIVKKWSENGDLIEKVPSIEPIRKSNSGSNIKLNLKGSSSVLNNPSMITHLSKQKVKNGIEEYKHQINQFINKMNEMPDWYEIIQARANGHAMMAESMNIKVDDYEFWANAHKEEYVLKYNDGNLDVEGIKLRIEKFGFIVSELEKVIKKAAELKLNITHEMHNDYCAARASILGAEYALVEMTK